MILILRAKVLKYFIAWAPKARKTMVSAIVRAIPAKFKYDAEAVLCNI
jgi:hypothetical protein